MKPFEVRDALEDYFAIIEHAENIARKWLMFRQKIAGYQNPKVTSICMTPRLDVDEPQGYVAFTALPITSGMPVHYHMPIKYLLDDSEMSSDIDKEIAEEYAKEKARLAEIQEIEQRNAMDLKRLNELKAKTQQFYPQPGFGVLNIPWEPQPPIFNYICGT